MREVTGNLWTYPADVRVITTNGTVKKNGECVMGRGCAAEAKKKWPDCTIRGDGIAKMLGSFIKERGNTPAIFGLGDYFLITFLVKHNWYEKADLALIKESATMLAGYKFKDILEGKTIVLPRPGCGNGGLRWEDVKPVLEPILDDRFHVITF